MNNEFESLEQTIHNISTRQVADTEAFQSPESTIVSILCEAKTKKTGKALPVKEEDKTESEKESEKTDDDEDSKKTDKKDDSKEESKDKDSKSLKTNKADDDRDDNSDNAPKGKKEKIEMYPKLQEGLKIDSIVVPKMGPHVGQKHRVIHVFPDGKVTIVPINIQPARNRYQLGAVRAQPSSLTVISEDVFKDRQIKIAKQTLNMPDGADGLFGGPTKEEARKILKKFGVKFNESIEDIAKVRESALPTSEGVESAEYLSKLTDKELSKRLDVVRDQQKRAFAMKNTAALERLQGEEDRIIQARAETLPNVSEAKTVPHWVLRDKVDFDDFADWMRTASNHGYKVLRPLPQTHPELYIAVTDPTDYKNPKTHRGEYWKKSEQFSRPGGYLIREEVGLS